MKDIFYVISMLTKTNKIIYLKSNIGNSMEWTFDIQESVQFERQADAEEFAKHYFKNFKNYKVTQIESSI